MAPLPAHRPSQRDHLLAATLTLARTGATISLESAARAADVSKAGLMYHFRTKQELMAAVVDHLMSSYEADLRSRLPLPSSDAGVEARLTAYLEWACGGDFDCGDLIMFADPRLREVLTAQWNQRMAAWVDIPADVPAERRARLHSARLIADGMWLNAAAEGIPLPPADRAAVRRLAHQLIEGDS